MHRLPALALIPVLLCGCRPPADTLTDDHVSVGAAAAGEAGATPIDPPAGPGALAPELTAGPRGLWLSWLEKAGNGEPARHVLRASLWDGAGWSAPIEVISGEGFFANWADRPAVVETSGGTLYAHWLRKLGEGTYAYGVEIARSEDGGTAWDLLGRLHDDATASEHGFVSWAAAGDGLRAFWLDGRAMTGAEGGMQVRTAVLGPETSGTPTSTVLDRRACECCSTGAALTSRGPVVAFRDRSPEEIRNIAVVRPGDGADGAWTEAVPVHDDGWKILGCPVNGPAVDAAGERLAVAWYTGADPEPRVLLAFSDDAGATFGQPILVDDRNVGRVDVVLDDGGAVVSWLGKGAGDRGEVRVRRLTADGTAEPARTVGTTSIGRSAGVPRMARQGGEIVVAWIEDVEPSKLHAIRTSL